MPGGSEVRRAKNAGQDPDQQSLQYQYDPENLSVSGNSGAVRRGSWFRQRLSAFTSTGPPGTAVPHGSWWNRFVFPRNVAIESKSDHGNLHNSSYQCSQRSWYRASAGFLSDCHLVRCPGSDGVALRDSALGLAPTGWQCDCPRPLRTSNCESGRAWCAHN